MYQQTYCLTLPKPFFQIFYLEFMHQLYRHTYTISTPFSPRPASGFHTFRAHTATQTNPQRHRPPNLHAHTTHKPIHQRPQPHRYTHKHTPQIPRPYSPTDAHRHPRDAGPRRRCRRTAKRCHTPTLTFSPPQAGLQSGLQAGHADVVAAPMQSQPRTSPQLDRPDRQDQTKPNRTGSGHSRNWTGQVSDKNRLDQIRLD